MNLPKVPTTKSRSLSSGNDRYPSADDRQKGNQNPISNPQNSQSGVHAVQPIRPTYVGDDDEATTRKTREGGNNPSFATSQTSR